MANTQEQNKKLKNATKFLFALLILILLWAFFNDSTYNAVKKHFVKNADKYTEMYAYSKTKPKFINKYFILQGNDAAKSFFQKEVSFTDENSLDKIQCSTDNTVLIYEKPSSKINEFLKEKGAEEIVLNKGSNIEFYVATIKGSPESCKVGG